MSGIGVLVGGVLTGQVDWRWILSVCIAFAVLIAVLALRGKPESRDPSAPRSASTSWGRPLGERPDRAYLALIQGASWGWGSAAVVGLLVGAALLLVAFAFAERRASYPIVDFSFFRHRNFAGSTVVIFVLDFSFGALLFFLPLYLQEILGYSPTEVEALLLPLTGLMVVGSPLGGRAAARVRPRPPIAVGLAMMAVAVFWISTSRWRPTSASSGCRRP